jgi:hypothetical protein
MDVTVWMCSGALQKCIFGPAELPFLHNLATIMLVPHQVVLDSVEDL